MKLNINKKKPKTQTENSAFFAQKEPEQPPASESPFDQDITDIVENSWQASQKSKRLDIFFIVLMEAMQVQQQREILAKMDQLISVMSKKEAPKKETPKETSTA